MTKALLLYPEYPETFWGFKYALKFIHRKAALPPLGLLTVASMLPAGWDLRLVDLNVDKLGEKQLDWAETNKKYPDFIKRHNTGVENTKVDTCLDKWKFFEWKLAVSFGKTFKRPSEYLPS
jgi:hypothetical protein